MPEIIPNWHPILVHFTIGLLGAAVVFYVLSLAMPQWATPLRLAGRLNLWAGALVTVGTLLTGWHAYTTVPHDAASHEVMTVHRNWALITGGLFIGLALLLVARVAKGFREGPVFVLAMVLAGAPLTVTGYLGGELVYRHGVGVLSLPDVDDHHHGENGHDHAHAHDHDHDHDHGEPEAEGHDHGHD